MLVKKILVKPYFRITMKQLMDDSTVVFYVDKNRYNKKTIYSNAVPSSCQQIENNRILQRTVVVVFIHFNVNCSHYIGQYDR